jgi:hypothetical protein
MEANHSHFVPRLRVYGSIPPLPHIRSWHAQGQLYKTLFQVETCFLDFKLCHVLNVVLFLLGNSPASEF